MHPKHKMAMAVAAAFVAMAASPALQAAPNARPGPGQHARQGVEASTSSTCDPFADWDWEYEGSGGGNASSHLRASAHGFVPPQLPAGSAAQVIGTTPDAIERNFVGVVARNLADAGTASRIARLSDRELGAIARHAARAAPSERAALLKVFATRLDAPALVRVARAFGRAPVDAAVRAYAAPATRAAFAAGIAGLEAPPPEGGDGNPYPSPSPPRPTIDMTLEEIYLEFRTAPIGGLSVSASLAETAMFAGRYLRGPLGYGAAVGAAIHYLIEEFDPAIDDAIGATIAGMIDNFWEATGEVEQGHFESAFDSLFGFPVTWSSDPWGDWDVSDLMVVYYQTQPMCVW